MSHAMRLFVACALGALVLVGAGVAILGSDHADRKKTPRRTTAAPSARDAGDYWGWTAEREARAKRIFAADRVARSFFAGRDPVIEVTGPWNDERTARVLGGLLKVSVAKPVRGVHTIPGFLSTRRRTFKLFKVDVAGARKFHVIVDFGRGRVVEISPLAEGAIRARPRSSG
jgi:hypothetical protein